MKKLSVIIPSKEEREGIVGTIRAIPKDELEKMGYEVQILVVDSSSDDTAEFARQAGAEVVREPRLGYGRAYKTGFAHARGDIIVTADADMTYPIEEIPKLVRTLEEEGLDFITTNRFACLEEGAMSRLHRLGNFILNFVTRLLFGINLKDSQSGMWVFRKHILDRARLRADSMAFSEELKIEAVYFLGCRWKEVPIRYKVRVGEVKLRSWRHGLGNLFYLLRKRIMR